ncbi:MAG TPA: mechanosensitive ion channel protein MscS, partial [Gallionellaceae bacterium]
AKTDVECYRVDKDMFEEILHARPAIAEEMSQVMAIRKAEQNMALHEISEESAHLAITQQRKEILATIRRFFGLEK